MSNVIDDIVQSVMDERNEYIKKVLYKHMSLDGSDPVIRNAKLRSIDNQLKTKLKESIEDIEARNYNKIIINALLREKLKNKDENYETEKTNKIIGLIGFALVIVSNVCQFLITKYS